MWIKIAPHDTIACDVEQFYHVEQWQIDPYLQCGAICHYLTNLQYMLPYCDLRWSKITNIMYGLSVQLKCYLINSRIAKNIFVVALGKAWSEFPLFFLWVIFTLCCEFTCDVKVGVEIYGGGWKGDLGAGTMDSEADNPEYLQHHGQKVLKWNKREGRTKVVSFFRNEAMKFNLKSFSWFSRTPKNWGKQSFS